VLIPTQKLAPADAAILETFVVPRYLSLFGELALDMLLVGESAHIAHVCCRTGYPDRKILELADGATLVGIDSSLPAVELARNKASVLGEAIDYRVVEELPGELETETFSNALVLHPTTNDADRGSLFSAMAELLYSGGQAIVALPLKGSFQEIADLLREYALKYDDGEFSKAVEEAAATRPTIETLHEELENAGLEDIDVEIRQTTIAFDSGRAFIEDPVSRLLILPELRNWLSVTNLDRQLEYVRDAIDKYWSEGKLELSLNVGCASARKP
jgi:ubiquinone/menaquinone biosynthesis C-methylase UbiE